MKRPVKEITVKREGLAVRCEVCHQTDRFDPKTGVCRRCSSELSGKPDSKPSNVFEQWAIPEPFQSVFLELVGKEPVRWVGRPVKRLARHSYQIPNFLLAVMLTAIVFGLTTRMFDAFGFAFISGVIGIRLFFRAYFGNSRIDRTLYVLTKTRAIVLRSDRPSRSKVYSLSGGKPRFQRVDEKENIGHVIFFSERYYTNLGGLGAWDNPRHFELISWSYDRGFFYIENIRETERLVREPKLRWPVVE
jgi:hypothetical protein